jgi:hypothetical protein
LDCHYASSFLSGRILKNPTDTKKAEVQAKVEIRKVSSSLNLDLSLLGPSE